MSKIDASELDPATLEAMKSMGLDVTKLVKNIPQQTDYLTTYLEKFVTNNPEMLEIKERVKQIAPTDYPVLIIGPTGTGKELLASALHGSRPADKFIPVNCAGIPESLAESELFGHVKGAFTNAAKDRKGHFECAEGGTIFLDEIGDLSFNLQAKLLRVLQEGTVRPVGSEKEVEVNCRVVCATHKNMEEQVECGRFREDLYYRLSTFTLKPTALVYRPKDVPLILSALDIGGKLKDVMDEFVRRIKKQVVEEGSETRVIYLPGNVRSLEQLLYRYIVLGLMPDEE